MQYQKELYICNTKSKNMKQLIKQKQVVAIFTNSYKVVYTDKDPVKVKHFADANRNELKKQGALKVITNIGFYEA